MPKLTPLRAMTVTMLLPGTPCAASDIDLQAAIEMLRKKWSLPATNVERTFDGCAVELGGEQGERETLEQEAGGGGVAVVQFIAHVQRLRHERLEVGIRQTAHRNLHRGEEFRAEPAQSFDDFGRVGAEAQHLAESLVQIAIGAVAAVGILHHPDRHRWADDARHRTDGRVFVARFERDAAGRRQLLRLLERGGPAFVEYGAGDRALLRSAHVRPVDRRTGMQNAPFALRKPGDGVLRRHQVDQARLRGKVAAVGDAVGFVDALVADEARERPAERGVRPRRRRPAQVRDLATGRGDVVGEALQADVRPP